MDGLRAIACLIVLVLHQVHWSFGIIDFGYGHIIRGVPKIGVWLFFVISAFLLTHVLLDDFSPRSIVEYAINRTLRIIPPFALAVVAYWLVGPNWIGIGSWSDAAAVLTFQKSAGHLWTIPVEFQFYVWLPLILLAAVTARRWFGGPGAIITVLALVAASTWVWPPTATPENSPNPGWYMICFCSGVVAALLSRSVHQPSRRIARAIGAVAVAAIIALTVSAKLDLFGEAETVLIDKHYLYGPLWAAVAYAVFIGGFARKALSARWLVSVGRASYSIYLYHLAICLWFVAMLPAVPALVGGVVASILIGMAAYRWTEKPTYKARATLAAMMQRRAVA